MNIAIIGAGVSGLLTALKMVERGCTVTIFDQQRTGSAASGAGGGILSRCILGAIPMKSMRSHVMASPELPKME